LGQQRTYKEARKTGGCNVGAGGKSRLVGDRHKVIVSEGLISDFLKLVRKLMP
jgi:hypothetical protein